jgi:hypothetical protein
VAQFARAEHLLKQNMAVNFARLFRAFETMMVLREAAKRFTASSDPSSPAPPSPAAMQSLAGQLEAPLTNVVVAALKEAFNRDHARLELERAQLEEERRRAEQALRQELRRQAADRELGRLRLLSVVSLAGWIASIAVFAAGIAGASVFARVLLALGWLLLLGALGMAFTAQGQVGIAVPDGDRPVTTAAAQASLWLLIAGLAASAFSLLL